VSLARHIESLKLPILGGRPFMTYAMRDQFSGQPPYGLSELVHATFQAVPEAVQSALVAAQRVDLDAKARAAQGFIGATVTASVAAAATPIPFSDAALLVPLQLAMMARIAQLYGMGVDRAGIAAVASTAVATTAGRASFTSLLKLIPGAGTIAGGAISASVAGVFTFAMGQAWLTVCQKSAGGTLPSLGGVTDSKALHDLFMSEFKRRIPGIRSARHHRRSETLASVILSLADGLVRRLRRTCPEQDDASARLAELVEGYNVRPRSDVLREIVETLCSRAGCGSTPTPPAPSSISPPGSSSSRTSTAPPSSPSCTGCGPG
jgi:uncharacterized protein (DUF697 family)